MGRKIVFCICILLVSTTLTLAQDGAEDPKKASIKNAGQDAKRLDGMSIVGNDEAPKSLYIVPWKNSEIGVETTLSMMLNDNEIPVDREVFSRQLEFYEISTKE